MKTLLISVCFSTLSLAPCTSYIYTQKPGKASAGFPYAGQYLATIPSASCEGLYSILRLNEDNTYQLRVKMLGVSDSFSYEKGTFTWDATKKLLKLSGAGPQSNLLRFDKGNFILLDKNGKIQGDDEAERASYEFRPTQNIVKEIRWLLSEINEQHLPQDEPYLQPPYVYFPLRDNSMRGFGGCNNFFGPVTLHEEGRITVSHIAATKKLCTDVTIESDYLQNLQSANRYQADEASLTLFRDEKPLLRFKAQY